MVPLEIGDPRQVGPFELLGRLGSGGMGVVYAARSERYGDVALKVIHQGLAREEAFVDRFRREVLTISRVRGDNVARFVAADPNVLPPWLATERLDGPTLSALVARRGPLSADDVLGTVASGVGRGLMAIHQAGVVHRDLKPSNVVLTPEGAKVIDFGIAFVLETNRLTTTGKAPGSAPFMSPEQAEGQAVGTPSDVFSLGGLLFHAATGRQPFGEGSAAAVGYRIVTREVDLSAIEDGRLRRLLSACMEKNPAMRPSAAEVVDLASGRAPARSFAGAVAAPVVSRITESRASEPTVIARAPARPQVTESRPAALAPAIRPAIPPAVAPAEAPGDYRTAAFWAPTNPPTPPGGASVPLTNPTGSVPVIAPLLPGAPNDGDGPPPAPSTEDQPPRRRLARTALVVVPLVVAAAIAAFVVSLGGDERDATSIALPETTASAAPIAGATAATASPTATPTTTTTPTESPSATETTSPSASATASTTPKASASKTTAATPPLSSSTGALPQGKVGEPYSFSLSASGGTAPYQWGLVASRLPDGLTLSSSGRITGTPTAPGARNVILGVSDADGASLGLVRTITITGTRAGDINGDGAVDCNDYAILAGDFGTTAARSDLNGDGTVDNADVQVLSENWTSSDRSCGRGGGGR